MLQTTRLSKFLSALLILGFALQWFLPDTRMYLALVPGKTLPMVWNLLSAGFLITNPVEVCVLALACLLPRISAEILSAYSTLTKDRRLCPQLIRLDCCVP